MGVHPNIHIPKESWPHWTWYAIECVVLIAVSLVASSKITDSFEGLNPRSTKLYVYRNFRYFLLLFGMLELDVLF